MPVGSARNASTGKTSAPGTTPHSREPTTNERHGEAERHADPAQLLALVTVGPSVAHYECHERRAEPADNEDRSDNAGRDHRRDVKRKRVLDRLGRTEVERGRGRDGDRREHRPRRNGGRNRPPPDAMPGGRPA